MLEEEEYLDRMKHIISRDFFPQFQFSDSGRKDRQSDDRWTSSRAGAVTSTPGTDRTQFSTASRQEACSLRLNDFLDRYTSEDNAYFDKLQKKEQRKHQAKYPWLYRAQSKAHNKQIEDQLKLPSISDQAAAADNQESKKMIDWPHTPNNSLFYPSKSQPTTTMIRKHQSIVNYSSNMFACEDIFKKPLDFDQQAKPRSFNRFSDKIGIDGKLLNGSETPVVNGYSFIPPPETSESDSVEKSRSKLGSGPAFYIPDESPRDELAHRVYEQKIARSARTPRLGASDLTPKTRTPSTRGNYASLSFSPGRVRKNKLRTSKPN